MILKKNQIEACVEVLRLMEQRKGESLSIIGAPDELERNSQAIDLHVRGSKGDYHLEHTLIESFPGQLADGSRFQSLMVPLQERLKGKLPSGHIGLFVQPGAITGTLDYKKIQDVLEKWVIEKSGLLSVQAFASKRNARCRETPKNMPFEVMLVCDPELNDLFYVGRYVTGDIEAKRRERIQSALSEKCPKLQEAKIKSGGSSVLIFESNDLALANHSLIGTAFEAELKKRDDLPDDVYLVETDLPDQWTIWILKESEAVFPDINEPGPRYIQRKPTV